MKKIFKILSILVIGFVMFSCSTPTNDPTPYIPEPSGPETPVETPSDDTEPSGPETPVETPSDDPVEETPKVQTYSITFVIDMNSSAKRPLKFAANALNNFSEFKNLKEGTKVQLYNIIYSNEDCSEVTSVQNENSYYYYEIVYESGIESVVIGKEDVEVVLKYVTPTDI